MPDENDDDNEKDPAWKVPVKLPHVKPEDYRVDIDSGRGSAAPKKPEE